MSRTIQSTEQMRGRQIPQNERKAAQAGKSLPGGSMKKSKKRKNNPRHT